MWSQPPQQDVRGNLEEDVGYEKDCQGSVVLRACEFEVLFEPVDDGIANVDALSTWNQPCTYRNKQCSCWFLPVEKGHDVNGAQDRQQPPVDFSNQRTLCRVGWALDKQVVNVGPLVDSMSTIILDQVVRRTGVCNDTFSEEMLRTSMFCVHRRLG